MSSEGKTITLNFMNYNLGTNILFSVCLTKIIFVH